MNKYVTNYNLLKIFLSTMFIFSLLTSQEASSMPKKKSSGIEVEVSSPIIKAKFKKKKEQEKKEKKSKKKKKDKKDKK
jgi:ABC-type lipoprotein release transport system permease subunit